MSSHEKRLTLDWTAVILVDIYNGVSGCLVPDVGLPATVDTFILGAHYTPSRLYEMELTATQNEIEKNENQKWDIRHFYSATDSFILNLQILGLKSTLNMAETL